MNIENMKKLRDSLERESIRAHNQWWIIRMLKGIIGIDRWSMEDKCWTMAEKKYGSLVGYREIFCPYKSKTAGEFLDIEEQWIREFSNEYPYAPGFASYSQNIAMLDKWLLDEMPSKWLAFDEIWRR